MDNDLITSENWWKRNWSWFIPLTAFVLLLTYIVVISIGELKSHPKNEIAFDKIKWKTKNDLDYPYRNKMLKDLLSSDTLSKLKKDQVLDLLGQADRVDKEYLFYAVAQERINFFPLHTKTLVIRFEGDGSVKWVRVHQ